MYIEREAIKTLPYDKLQIKKLVKNDAFEVLAIGLEKDAIFPEHTSPTDALLVVLEGAIDFHINGERFLLSKHEAFSFSKETPHWVQARENAKFMIVR